MAARREREHERTFAPILPKGTDLSWWSDREIKAVANALNTRSRKTLGWKTPAEVLNEHQTSTRQAGVATTG